MKKFNVFTLLIICFTFFTFSAKAQLFGTSFKCYTITPPAIYLNGVKKIAVLDFIDETARAKSYQTDGGAKTSDYIISNLMAENRGLYSSDKLYLTGMRTNIFTIVERSQLETVLREQNLGSQGVINDADAAKVGKILGIDAIISGSISYSYNDKTDKSSSTDSKTKKVTYTYTATRDVKSEARIKIISVQTGELLANATFSSAASDSKSSDSYISGSALRPVDDLKNQTFGGLAAKIANYICPTLHGTALDIKKIKVKELKEKGKEASSAIKDNQIDKAILIYKDLAVQDPYNQEVAYDLGVVYEGTGHFEKALQSYKVALQLDANERDYKDAVARCESDIKMVKFLADFGIVVTPYEFSAAGTGKLAPKVITKGKKKERFDVREQPNATSNVVAKVPGDTEFEVIKQEGDWYLIKLLGEQQGYVQSSNVEVKK